MGYHITKFLLVLGVIFGLGSFAVSTCHKRGKHRAEWEDHVAQVCVRAAEQARSKGAGN